MKLIIEDDEGLKTVVPLVREEITIGRQDGNTIRLTERNVSRRHARLIRNNGAVLIEDLGSSNGVRVNGERISGPTRILEGDLVEIGDYDLVIEGRFEATPKPTAQPTMPPPVARKRAEPPPPSPPRGGRPAGGALDTAVIRLSDATKLAPRIDSRDLLRSEMPRLVGVAGPVRGKELYLMRTDVRFGRVDGNDIVVDHPSVSRSHARFVLDGAHWKVIDSESANGVRINGEKYAVAGLKPGDLLELGHLQFRFCVPALQPATEELLASAQGPGASPWGNWRRAPPALIGAVVGAVVVAAGLAAFALGRSRHRQNESADAYRSMTAAIESGDGDKARSLFEKCSSERTWWCAKGAAMRAQVAGAYARKHLELAAAAKAAGRLDQCQAEAGNVLAFDAANAEAQSLKASCQPQRAEVKPATAKREASAARERNATAARLAKSAEEKLNARRFKDAIRDADAALARNPSDDGTRSSAWRTLGYANAYLADAAAAKKYLKMYQPFCASDCVQVAAFLNR